MLAGLELSKRRELLLRQSVPFAALWMYRRTLTAAERAAIDVPAGAEAWADEIALTPAEPSAEAVAIIDAGLADRRNEARADEAPDATDADH